MQQKLKAKVISATLLELESHKPEQLEKHQATPTASAERRKQPAIVRNALCNTPVL